ncbi:hypothetical protein ACHAXT_005802 [Thalassiosira profunda]
MCLATPPGRQPLFMKRHLDRRRHIMMMTACVLDMLDEDERKHLRGRLVGTKNVRRTRKKVENMFAQLGSYGRKAYRMSLESFLHLHDILEPALREEFLRGQRTRNTNNRISTKLRLSAAIRFFAGASIYDIILTHGIGKQSVYESVYGVVNAVNSEKSLSLNADNAPFPSHAEQREIAAGFRQKSAADFDKIVLALDGMLVWTTEPSKADCDYLKIGQRLFHCYRKDKYGWLLMAGCDSEARFRWADIRHPASTSDYLAWTTSELGAELSTDESNIILEDHVIAGDNAFVENMTMATPVPGMNISPLEDSYNFYLSQVRITIERAFGILVPVPAIVTCLMKLHNFCIDHDSRRTPSTIHEDERSIQVRAYRMPRHPTAVSLDAAGAPRALVGSGHHFRDEPGGTGRRPEPAGERRTPMRKMMRQVARLDLLRPPLE